MIMDDSLMLALWGCSFTIYNSLIVMSLCRWSRFHSHAWCWMKQTRNPQNTRTTDMHLGQSRGSWYVNCAVCCFYVFFVCILADIIPIVFIKLDLDIIYNVAEKSHRNKCLNKPILSNYPIFIFISHTVHFSSTATNAEHLTMHSNIWQS